MKVDLVRDLKRILEAREAARRAARRPAGRYLPRDSRNALIRSKAIVCEAIPESRGAAELWITYHPGREEFLRIRQDPRLIEALSKSTRTSLDPDALNGYVAFDRRRAPGVPRDCPLADFVPVHGGISYRVKDSTAAVWGFDTMHVGSENLPRTDKVWMRAQCLVLWEHLILCGKHWPEYRRAGRKRRIEILEDVFGQGRSSSELGVNAMLRLMTEGV